MAEFASRGVAGTGLGLGIAGTALGVLNGGLGNILGGMAAGCGCANGDNMPVNRYEAAKDAKIAELEVAVSLRDATAYTLGEVGKLRDYFEGKFDRIEGRLCEQATYNAANTASVNCLAGQIQQLYSLTKLVIPNASVCPGWGNVTVAPATTTAGA